LKHCIILCLEDRGFSRATRDDRTGSFDKDWPRSTDYRKYNKNGIIINYSK